MTTLDTIKFIPALKGDTNHSFQAIETIINYAPLIDIITDIEDGFPENLGSRNIAGDYAGNTLTKRIEAQYLGTWNNDWSIAQNKTPILTCWCGCDGCWPLLCVIDISEDKVVWREFEQEHRDIHSASGHWDYSALKPFVFDKQQYVKAVKQLGVDLLDPTKVQDDRIASNPENYAEVE